MNSSGHDNIVEQVTNVSGRFIPDCNSSDLHKSGDKWKILTILLLNLNYNFTVYLIKTINSSLTSINHHCLRSTTSITLCCSRLTAPTPYSFAQWPKIYDLYRIALTAIFIFHLLTCLSLLTLFSLYSLLLSSYLTQMHPFLVTLNHGALQLRLDLDSFFVKHRLAIL